uniref:Uncharacterized protein n=1 Tax=Rhodnius prolixus TaxID=13249 RepID=T1I800_RHOPR
MDYYRNSKKNPSNIILNPEEMDTTTLSIQDMDLTLMANTESKLSISFSDQILDDSCLELQDDFNTTKMLLRKPQTKEINSICLENTENDFSTTDEEEEEESNVTILYNNSNNEKCNLSKLKLNNFKSKESSQDSSHNYSGNLDKNSASNLDDSIEANLEIATPLNAEKFENHQAKIKLQLLNYLYDVNSYTRFIHSATESPFIQQGNVFNEVKTILNKNLTENEFISSEIDYNSFSCEDFVRINKERMNLTSYNHNLLSEHYLEFNKNEIYLNEKFKDENIAINNETNSRSVEKSKNSTSCPSIESSDIKNNINFVTCLNNSFCNNDSESNTDDIKTLLSSSLSPITTKTVSADNDSKQLRTTVLQFEKGSTDGSIILPIIDKENDKKYDNCKFSIFTESEDNVPIINNSLEVNFKSLLVKNETFKKYHSKNDNISKNEHFSLEFTVLEKLKKILGRYRKLFNKYRKNQQFSKLELELKSLVDELQEKFEMQNLNQEQRSLKESEVVNTFKVARPKLFKSNADKLKKQENNFNPNQNCTYSLRNKPTKLENVQNNYHKLLLKREIINDKAKKNKEITDYSDFAKLWKRELSNNVKENKNSGIKEYVNKHVKYKEMKSVPVKTIKRNKNDKVLIKKEKLNTILEQKPTMDISIKSNSTKIFPSNLLAGSELASFW